MSTRERVIEESTKLFVQQGVRAIRMDDIAAHLGISKRTIYEMFGDKEQLIIECLKLYFTQHRQAAAERMARTANLIEEFIVLLDNWDQMEVNLNLISGIKKFYPKVYHMLTAERNKKDFTELKNRVEDGIRQGLFLPHVNIDLAVSVFGDSAYGLIVRPEEFVPTGVTVAEAFKYISIYFLRGISTDRGIRIIDEYLAKTDSTKPVTH